MRQHALLTSAWSTARAVVDKLVMNRERKTLGCTEGAFGAIGRISPDSMIQDAVVPRSRLPEVLSSAYEDCS